MVKLHITAFLSLIFMTLGGLAPHVQAQAPDYSYEDFRFPDIDRKALELETSMNASSTSPTGTGEHWGFRNSLTATYSRFRNLEKIQAFEQYSLHERFSARRSQLHQSAPDRRVVHLSGDLNAYKEYRYYYKPNRFYEYRLTGAANYNYARTDNLSLNTRDVTQSGAVSAGVGLFTGWGRLEPIDDVFLAKFTLDEMQAAGLITENISQEQLFSLGQRMAFIRNQRIFDFRRQRIYELEQLDDWFKEHTELDETSILFFTTLTDNWLYGFRNTRFSGWRISLGLEPVLLWQRLLGSVNVSNARFDYSLAGIAERHRPINQFWQREYQLSAGVGHFFRETDIPGVILRFEPYLQASTGWGWYPNTRTRVSSRGVLNYSPIIDPDNFSPAYVNRFISSLQFDADYFINFQMRLSGFISLDNTFGFSERFSMSGGVRLIYNIF